MTGYGGVGACCGGGLVMTGFDSLAMSVVAVVLMLAGLLLLRIGMVRRRTER